MDILAIDPGCTDSAYVVVDAETYAIREAAKVYNPALAARIRALKCPVTVVEMVACYGMPVGREVFETCVWIGRFMQIAAESGAEVDRIYRQEEKLNLCHDSRAKDANIMRALIDRFATHDLRSGKGTKNNPDTFYGFRADMWAAAAVAVTWIDKYRGLNSRKDGAENENNLPRNLAGQKNV